MTTKDYIKIIDSVIETPRVKRATLVKILERLGNMFSKDNPLFNSTLYNDYCKQRLDERYGKKDAA